MRDYNIVPVRNYSEFLNALTLKPIAIGISAGSLEFRYYSGGILNDDKDFKCGTSLNHAVLAVGYHYTGNLTSPENYILIKNSWSSLWGESGFARIGFGSQQGGGTCGMLLDPTYVLVNKL